jgi:hypothetical protein
MRRFLFRWIDSFEKKSGVSAEYARWMANVSPKAFLKFGKLGKLAQYRNALPADASAVAHLVAARSEDCGPCVQIGINFTTAYRRTFSAPSTIGSPIACRPSWLMSITSPSRLCPAAKTKRCASGCANTTATKG